MVGAGIGGLTCAALLAQVQLVVTDSLPAATRVDRLSAAFLGGGGGSVSAPEMGFNPPHESFALVSLRWPDLIESGAESLLRTSHRTKRAHPFAVDRSAPVVSRFCYYVVCLCSKSPRVVLSLSSTPYIVSPLRGSALLSCTR